MTRKLLSPQALHEAVSLVHSIALSEGISTLLVGGYAMQFYGSDRLTADVDILASRRIECIVNLGPLSFGGSQSRVEGVPLDVIVRTDDYRELYNDALVRGVTMNNCPMRIARPEHLLAMKLASGRPKDDQDIAYFITSKTADLRSARGTIKRFLGAYAANDFDSVVSEIEWKASRGKL